MQGLVSYSSLSIVDDAAVDPHAAESVLHRLARRSREGFTISGTCVSLGVAFFLLSYQQILLPSVAGSIVGAFIGFAARGQRNALLLRLVGQKSAYAIPAVAKAAERYAGRQQRQILAREIARLVFVAQGLEPERAYGEGLSDRIIEHADDLLGIAYLLARTDTKVHPASVALVDRLLHTPLRSPLFSRQVPEQHLMMAILRVRSQIG